MGNIEKIEIRDEYITLGQLLKITDVVSSGGEVKSFLATNTIYVNNEEDNRRGRKSRPGDRIRVLNREFEIC